SSVILLFFMLSLSVFVFFFFQAEDGIRDLTVTGVQTCALPIYGRGRPEGHGHPGGRRLGRVPRRSEPVRAAGPRDRGVGRGRGRSEERRVGKEWRAGRGPEQ